MPKSKKKNSEKPPARSVDNPLRFMYKFTAIELQYNAIVMHSAMLTDAVNEISKDKDSLSGISETAQLYIEMVLDSMQKAISMMDNLQKKMQEVEGVIVRNMK